jgi:uncharacterized membrane protein
VFGRLVTAPVPVSRGIRATAGSQVVQRALAVTLVACAAMVVRCLGLGDHSLWFDEALEYERAVQPLLELVRARGIDQDPPLYAAALHVWSAVADHEAWLRLPSALFGAATAAVLCGWAWRRFGRFVAVLSGLLVAAAPVLVYYGQEVNQYALVALLGVAMLVAYERVVDRGSTADWLVYAAISVVALLSHYGMAFLLALLGAGLVRAAWRDGSAVQRRSLATYAALMLCLAAALWWLGLGEGLSVAHVQRRFGGTYVQKEIDYVRDVVWREVLVFYTVPFSGGPALWIPRTFAIVAAAGAILLWRGGPSGGRVVVLFVGTLVLTYLTSLMGWYPLGHRHGLFVAPWVMLAVAVAMDAVWRRSRPLGAIGAAAAVLALAMFVPQRDAANRWMHVPREHLRPVAEYVLQAHRSGDAVYVHYGAVPALGYYWRNAAVDVMTGVHPNAKTAQAEIQRIRAAAEIQGRVWLLMSHGSEGDGQALLPALTAPVDGLAGLRLVDSVRADGAAAYALEP